MSLRAKSFSAFVAEQERDPEFKALLDTERARLRGDEPPAAGVREPRRPLPPDTPAFKENDRRG